MRIVTWNACKGQFENKAHYLDHLQADIAIVQEIARPKIEDKNVVWSGQNPNLGLAVIAKPPYRLRALPSAEGAPNYVIPISVSGPICFVLLGVWTLGAKPYPYVQGANRAIDLYEPLFQRSPVVMAGDFNSNAIWDKAHRAGFNHSSMLSRLERHGMVSAYHCFTGRPHGAETAHTFHHHRKEEKPYHIDFCFLPRLWAERIKHVDVGSYAAWSKCSDHCPLLVDFDVPATAGV